MKKNFTLNELKIFTQTEKTQREELLEGETKAPKQSTIDTILNFSKVLSVRKSKNISTIEMVLN